MQPIFTIIIPTRNRAHLLARVLASLGNLTFSDWDAIVVDDGSTDDTAAVVERFRRQGLPVQYLFQPWQKMGAARNLGLRHARGEFVAFTDDDCTVDPAWLSALAEAFATHPEALGVQGKTVTNHERMTPFTRQVEQLEGGQPYRTCNIAYRATVLRELGGFDPHLIRGEDVVMGMRVLERGPIVFAPEAVVVHPPRPKEWADRAAWRTLLESEVHFKRTYPRYAPERSQTLSLQKPEHVLVRWVVLPIRRYWRWHYAYFRRHPGAYLAQVPSIVREKISLFSLLPYFLRRWFRGASPGPALSSTASSPVDAEEPSGLVSVVVPTRNRVEFLPRLLAALDAQDYPSYEAVVVDDASTDSTAEILSAWQGESRIALRLQEPAGSYAARNRGWRASSGGIIAFTDDDCLPHAGWLSALVRALEREGATGAQGVTRALPGEITPFTHQIEQTEPGTPYRTCNIAYRRSTLATIGGFDSSLRWYADNLFGLQARRMGLIAFAPDAVVHHPPRRKEWRDRETWLARFAADAEYRRRLHQLGLEPPVPATVLPVLLWVVRPLVKQTGAHLRYLLRHPVRYVRQAPGMAREKRALLSAIVTSWRRRRQPEASVHGSPPLSALPDDPLVSVIVVTAGRPALLEGALGALAGQTWKNREVLVVAHGDQEDTRQVAERWGARYLAVAQGELGYARQRGVSEARGALVFFTDDDCLPAARWLEAAVNAFRDDPEMWGVQGRTVAEVGPVGSHAVRVSQPDPLYQTCNIAYRREALARVQGFDTEFQGWFEDTALGARVRERGTIGWAPEMVVAHRAVPRRALDRERWRRLLADERRLATTYRAFYWRTRGPGFLVTVLSRWLLGSPLKTLLRELPRASDDPRGYFALTCSLLRERIALIAALAGLFTPRPRR